MRMSINVVATGASTATVIFTQDEVDALRGSAGKGRVPLAVTFEGKTFRTSVSVYRGKWMMVVNREMRDAGLTPGEEHVVDIAKDTQERTVDVPDDLAKALQAQGLRQAFDELSYTARKEHVRLITEAKKPETRQRRIDKVVDQLAGG